MGNTAIYGV
jgi:hypothetical protein